MWVFRQKKNTKSKVLPTKWHFLELSSTSQFWKLYGSGLLNSYFVLFTIPISEKLSDT